MNQDLFESLLEYGYPLKTLPDSDTKSEYGTCYRLKTSNDSPYLIIFITTENCNLDVGTLYELYKQPDDELCSYFILNSIENIYSKNMKTHQYLKVREPFSYVAKVQSTSVNKQALTSKFENVFFEAHSFLRDLDGLHPDEALDELCKLVYTKLYAEESNQLISSDLFGNAEEYAAYIRKLYKTANEYDVRVYSQKIPGYKRSRGVFNEDIHLSSNAIYKALSLFCKYDFSSANIDIKARAFQNVYKPATRSGMGQYFTPIQVIRFIVKCISPQITEMVIDPFSGSGHFLTEALNVVMQTVTNEKAKNEFIFYKLHGIEKSERMVRIAMTDMRLHGDGHSNIRCTDSLLSFDSYSDLLPNSFDIVMTNPPFGSSLQSDSYSYFGEYELMKGRSKIPLEVLGLERSIQLLQPNGRMGIVLPDSILVNKSYRYVRKWISENVTIRGIVSLPLTTFTPFGANIKTSILFITKRKSKELDYNIFTGSIEDIGFDSKGEDTSSPDWEELANNFLKFIEKEGW
ncbi:MAG: N-6 DNA methylase [Muribaculum sp.]|nr:N-6 DNA methylase [Muribaculum sp.]